MRRNKPVLIAGAGPTGLALALALGLEGVDVVLLEREPALTIDLRAGSLHPPTVEMLVGLGCGDELLTRGIQVPVWQIRDRIDGVVASFDLSLLKDVTAYPYRLHLEQHRLTPILLERISMATPSVSVRFAAGLAGVRDILDGVVATLDSGEEIAGSVMVGCDGARSVVRQTIGAQFTGFTWPERLLVASTTFDLGGLGFSQAGYVADPVNWAAVFKVPDDGPPGLWRIAYPIDPDVEEDVVLAEERIQERLRIILEHTNAGVDRWPLKYRSTYKVHQRVADRFYRGRLVIAGDAAHLNNPIGGLGLNGGIHDAVNLAGKLAPLWHGSGDHERAFALYERQRRPINIKAVQAMSIRNKRLLEEADPAVRRARLDEVRGIASDPVRARAYLLETSMIKSVREAAAITLDTPDDANWSGATA